MTREQVQTSQDNWKYRRRMAFSSVWAMLGMMGYLTIWGSSDNAVQSMLAQALPLGIVGVVVSYVIGPIADDWLQLRVTKS